MKTHLFFLTLAIFSCQSHAQPRSNVSEQVAFLVHKMKSSDCQFIGNGEAYNQELAANYIEKKWDYAKEQIDSIDAFIDNIASRSWFSGREYRVVCNGKSRSSRTWFKNTLRHHKNN